ncbi:MAG: sigma-70 family RNA polymerase sigma factor [Ignavibacteriae bacterium]|nr:sigma-70 family RNA polymerase sigma factor [Ignavibacteriota bacterium]
MTFILLAAIVNQAARNEEDLKLLLRVKDRDEGALSELYDRYSSLVYTFVLKVVKATDEAEDLVQEIFLQVWNKASMFAADKGSVYTWIVTIARRKAIDRLRSKDLVNRGQSLDDDSAIISVPDAAYMANPLHAAISNEYEALMREGLAQLSAEQRTVIELSYFEGYTQEQIAERLNAPLGTIKTRMRQGLMKLRDSLQRHIEA